MNKEQNPKPSRSAKWRECRLSNLPLLELTDSWGFSSTRLSLTGSLSPFINQRESALLEERLELKAEAVRLSAELQSIIITPEQEKEIMQLAPQITGLRQYAI